MKSELEQKDILAIAREAAQEVLKALKPLLKDVGEEDVLFTVKTLAEYLQVSEQWVYKRVEFKEIPYTKICKPLWFKKSNIDRWLEENKTPAVNSLTGHLKMVK